MNKIAMSPADQLRFELQFDDYYDVHHRDGIWFSAFNVPAHTDEKIAQFIRSVFDWSNKYRLNATWCREHAYETLDLWSQSELYKKARIWSYSTAHVSSSQLVKAGYFVTFTRHFQPLPQEFAFKR